MITISLKKVFYKNHELYEYVSPDQNYELLDETENINITIDHIPFVGFKVGIKNGKYWLTSISPISLKTYTEQVYRVEKWGDDFDSVRDCVNKCISVMGGFINRIGKVSVNDDDFYKEN